MGDVRDMDRQLLLDDPAGLAHARPSMPFRDVYPLDDEPPLLGKDSQDLPGPALVPATDNDDIVTLLDLQLRHGTLLTWSRTDALSARLRGGEGEDPSHKRWGG